MMHGTQQKEQFSLAYIHAVATVAGCTLSDPRVDDNSIDLLVSTRSHSGRRHSPHLSLQVKCTNAHLPGAQHLAFPLKMKNYDELRDPEEHVPRILVVVCVPANVNDWLEHSEDELSLKKCGYWLSLVGQPFEPSAAKDPRVTVHLPRSQQFNVPQLQNLMDIVQKGGRP